MEEDMSAAISNGTTDSVASALPHLCPRKRKRDPATGFKGVVLQQNGRWGAQIYADHRRVWLGTFKSEAEAAMAYDSAAIRLRGGDSHRNIPWAAVAREPAFQARLPTDALLAMIKDGSYRAKLAEFLREGGPVAGANGDGDRWPGEEAAAFRQLFRKELTPSDVGKLNRLVIPKKHAVKHFPRAEVGAELVFRDSTMRLWKFRYCYWRSSQSFVFTRGWNRFIKERRLRENDAVAFYSCERGPGGTFLVIDAVRTGEDANQRCPISEVGDDQEEAGDKEKKPIMLFGVQLNG